jgi:DNA-binding beta-propeller fold protein YncE
MVIRRRSWRLVAPVVVTLTTAGLGGCISESVTPGNSHVVTYAAVGATSANPGNTVAVISDAGSNAGRPVTVGTLPSALALVAGAADLVVTVKAQNELVEVATATGKVVGRVGVGLEPDAVAVTPDGKTALVANFGDNTVTEVHLSGLTAGRTIHVGGQPVSIALTPDGRQALVANYRDGTLTPVTLPSLTPGATIPVGAGPMAVSVPSATEALVANFPTSSITPIALPSLAPQPSLPLGANPTGIASVLAGTVAWVSAGYGITPVTLAGNVIGKAIQLGVPAECVAVTRHGQGWVCSGNGALIQVDLASGRVLRTVAVGGIPAAAVIADTGSS